MVKTLKGLYLAGTHDGLGTEESSFSWMMFCTMVWTGEPYRCPTALGQSPLQYRGLYLCGATIQLSHFSWLKLSLKSWSSHSFWGKRNCLKYSLRFKEAGTRGFFNSELTASWLLRWREDRSSYIIPPVLRMRKRSHGELKWPAQGHLCDSSVSLWGHLYPLLFSGDELFCVKCRR